MHHDCPDAGREGGKDLQRYLRLGLDQAADIDTLRMREPGEYLV